MVSIELKFIISAPILLLFLVSFDLVCPALCHDVEIASSTSFKSNIGQNSDRILTQSTTSNTINDFVHVYATVFIKLNNRMSTMDNESISFFEVTALNFLQLHQTGFNHFMFVEQVMVQSQTNTLSEVLGHLTSDSLGGTKPTNPSEGNRRTNIARTDIIVEVRVEGLYDLNRSSSFETNGKKRPSSVFKEFVLSIFAENFFEFLLNLSSTNSIYFEHLISSTTQTYDPTSQGSQQPLTAKATLDLSGSLNRNVLYASFVVGVSIAMIASAFFVHQYSKNNPPYRDEGNVVERNYREELPVCIKKKKKRCVPMHDVSVKRIKKIKTDSISIDEIDDQFAVTNSSSLEDSVKGFELKNIYIDDNESKSNTVSWQNSVPSYGNHHRHAQLPQLHEESDRTESDKNYNTNFRETISAEPDKSKVRSYTKGSGKFHLSNLKKSAAKKPSSCSPGKKNRTVHRTISRDSSFTVNSLGQNNPTFEESKKVCNFGVSFVKQGTKDWFIKASTKLRVILGMPSYRDDGSIADSRATSYDESTLNSLNADLETLDETTVFSEYENPRPKYIHRERLGKSKKESTSLGPYSSRELNLEVIQKRSNSTAHQSDRTASVPKRSSSSHDRDEGRCTNEIQKYSTRRNDLVYSSHGASMIQSSARKHSGYLHHGEEIIQREQTSMNAMKDDERNEKKLSAEDMHQDPPTCLAKIRTNQTDKKEFKRLNRSSYVPTETWDEKSDKGHSRHLEKSTFSSRSRSSKEKSRNTTVDNSVSKITGYREEERDQKCGVYLEGEQYNNRSKDSQRTRTKSGTNESGGIEYGNDAKQQRSQKVPALHSNTFLNTNGDYSKEWTNTQSSHSLQTREYKDSFQDEVNNRKFNRQWSSKHYTHLASSEMDPKVNMNNHERERYRSPNEVQDQRCNKRKDLDSGIRNNEHTYKSYDSKQTMRHDGWKYKRNDAQLVDGKDKWVNKRDNTGLNISQSNWDYSRNTIKHNVFQHEQDYKKINNELSNQQFRNGRQRSVGVSPIKSQSIEFNGSIIGGGKALGASAMVPQIYGEDLNFGHGKSHSGRWQPPGDRRSAPPITKKYPSPNYGNRQSLRTPHFFSNSQEYEPP